VNTFLRLIVTGPLPGCKEKITFRRSHGIFKTPGIPLELAWIPLPVPIGMQQSRKSDIWLTTYLPV
jgi:hypothetical protein